MDATTHISPHALVEGESGSGCTIGPFAVIGPGATLGENCVIHPHAIVGGGARVGADVSYIRTVSLATLS